MESDPLPFDIPPAEPRTLAARSVSSTGKSTGRPVYRRLHNSRMKCDDCLDYCVENFPHDRIPLRASFERRVTGQGARLLCWEHKHLRTEQEAGR